MNIGRCIESFNQFKHNYLELTRHPYKNGYAIDSSADSVLLDKNIQCALSQDDLKDLIVRLNCDAGDHYNNYDMFAHEANDRIRCVVCRTYLTPDKVTILMKDNLFPSFDQKEAEEKSNSPTKNRYRPLKAELQLKPEVQDHLQRPCRSFAVLNILDWTVYYYLAAMVTISKSCFMVLHATLMCICSPLIFPCVMSTNNLEGQQRRFNGFFFAFNIGISGIAAFFLPITSIITIAAVYASIYFINRYYSCPEFTPRQIWSGNLPKFKPTAASFCHYRNDTVREACEMVLNRATIAKEMPLKERMALTARERIPLSIGPNGGLDDVPGTLHQNIKTFREGIVWNLPAP